MNALVYIPGLQLAKPMLTDFAYVAHNLPLDQRQQWEALSDGQPFDAEDMATHLAAAHGPRWLVLTDEGHPIIIGGFTYLRPGVWQDWLISTPEAWTTHWRAASKLCRRMIDAMFEGDDTHRIQCVALADREAARKWYRILGYEFEGTLRRYGAHGEDAVMYARVKDGQ